MKNLHVTSNRARIYHERDERLHSFCLCFYINAGSMYESRVENGISHFFEHVIFRNIHHLMDHSLYQTLDRLGLDFNATTYKEFMEFTITGAPDHFLEAAKIITMILAPLSLSEEEIDVERKRILAEIREEEEEDSLSYFAKQIVWKDTSLAYTITGPKKNLESLHLVELFHFQKKVLTPDNVFFYLTGNFTEDMLESLSECISAYEFQPGPLGRNNIAPIPDKFGKRKQKVYSKKGKKTEVYFGIDIDSVKYNSAELHLLYDILFQGDFCKIHQALSEKNGYVYSYDAWLEEYRNVAHIHLLYEVDSEHLEDSVREVFGVLCQMKNGITDELDYVKPYYVDNANFLLDQAEEYNWLRAYENNILRLPYKEFSDRTESYRKVTPKKLTKICKNIFKKENIVLCVQGKKKKIDKNSLKECFDLLYPIRRAEEYPISEPVLKAEPLPEPESEAEESVNEA